MKNNELPSSELRSHFLDRCVHLFSLRAVMQYVLQ